MSYIHFYGRNAQSLTNKYKKWIIFIGQNVSLAWFSVIQCLMLTTAVQFFQSQENLKCNVGYSWEISPAIKIYEGSTKQIQLHKQNTLHKPLMKFWKQDIQVLYLLRLNPSNNSSNDFEQYSAVKNGPFHYILKVDFWRKKWQLYPKKILHYIDEFMKMKKQMVKLKFHGWTDPNRTQCDTVITYFQNASLEVQT